MKLVLPNVSFEQWCKERTWCPYEQSPALIRSPNEPVLCVHPHEVNSLLVLIVAYLLQYPCLIWKHYDHLVSPSEQLPCLMTLEAIITSDAAIQRFMERKTGISLDQHQSRDQKLVSVVLLDQLNGNMIAFSEDALWRSETVFNQFTRPRFGAGYVWPLSYLIPQMKRTQILRRMVATQHSLPITRPLSWILTSAQLDTQDVALTRELWEKCLMTLDAIDSSSSECSMPSRLSVSLIAWMVWLMQLPVSHFSAYQQDLLQRPRLLALKSNLLDGNLREE